jgi:hypothetical protein
MREDIERLARDQHAERGTRHRQGQDRQHRDRVEERVELRAEDHVRHRHPHQISAKIRLDIDSRKATLAPPRTAR